MPVDRRGERLRAGRRLRAGAGVRLHLRLAQRRSSACPRSSLGVIPGFGGTQRLARRVGVAQRARADLHGRRSSTPRRRCASASSTRVVGARRADAAGARDRRPTSPANGAAGGRGGASGWCHRARCASRRAARAALALERAAFGGLFATADQKEGMRAFIAQAAAPVERRMNFDLSPEQKLIQDTARDFATPRDPAARPPRSTASTHPEGARRADGRARASSASMVPGAVGRRRHGRALVRGRDGGDLPRVRVDGGLMSVQ